MCSWFAKLTCRKNRWWELQGWNVLWTERCGKISHLSYGGCDRMMEEYNGKKKKVNMSVLYWLRKWQDTCLLTWLVPAPNRFLCKTILSHCSLLWTCLLGQDQCNMHIMPAWLAFSGGYLRTIADNRLWMRLTFDVEFCPCIIPQV